MMATHALRRILAVRPNVLGSRFTLAERFYTTTLTALAPAKILWDICIQAILQMSKLATDLQLMMDFNPYMYFLDGRFMHAKIQTLRGNAPLNLTMMTVPPR
ncbi:MAG: hypothetical protein C4523_07210 [Myxococcales bacterium]|nr:MAG: hypothetical protein C4523_07210 [Myxococcales bacterium]